jgi:hypothetical protein
MIESLCGVVGDVLGSFYSLGRGGVKDELKLLAIKLL